jgi:hypothetical protein
MKKVVVIVIKKNWWWDGSGGERGINGESGGGEGTKVIVKIVRWYYK